ncbi:hypothetical protein [Pelolinea submarina]|uniref:Nuclease-like protein n=1 Tax=Pelolinea submarina TaxID=913107 RepID=A0A347ZT75_9CHLR|nr:hypothetical protein [Pelolinea submarina]REG10919.1 hypothetical protein DFR64_0788 [Pelolinea submarina]BBB48506.1 hypothetical protein Pelsub_P1734 [Pelolinea submarina]
MKIYNNQKLIKKRKILSQVILYFSMAMLTLGFLWSLSDSNKSQLTYAYLILIPAYLLVQVSIYMANKWGRSPRPDEIVASSLKGLNNQYTLYNYMTDVPHLLIGPAGVYLILPYYHSGTISYNTEKQRYQQKGGPGFFTRTFAQEGIPSIEKEDKDLIKDYQNYLQKNKLTINADPQVVNLFYSEKVELHTDNAPVINLTPDKFKDVLRQNAKKNILTDADIKQITDRLPISTE